MRTHPTRSQLAAIVTIRSDDANSVIRELSVKVMTEFGGTHLGDAWLFSSSVGAVLAANDLYRLSKEAAVAFVMSGEYQPDGRLGRVLVERAKRVCAVLPIPGVFACPATHSMSADHLPSDLWFHELGTVPIDSDGVERLSILCRGADDPNLLTFTARTLGIPRPVESFVGREAEIQRVSELLTEWFLVTIVGPPGIGKSAVAAETARFVEADYPDGIYWIDCDGCTDFKSLLDKLQRATWQGKVHHAEPLPMLAHRLGKMSALVVFDNCELVISEVRSLAQSLMEGTTTLGLLVTSTSAINTAKEHAYTMPPLSLPVPGSEFEALRRFTSDALALFAERAQAAHPDFTLVPENVEIVADICRELEGNALAIEIVAAKVRTRSLKQLQRDLRKVLSFKNEHPSRRHHRSLKAAHSHALSALPEDAGELLMKLSLFEGEFSYEFAEHVWAEDCAHGGFDSCLEQLVRSTLLTYLQSSASYSISQPLRLFLREELESVPFVSEAKRRFSNKVFDGILETKAWIDDKKQDLAFRRLDEYGPNIERAFRVAFDLADLHSRIPTLMTVMPLYWLTRNKVIEVDVWMADTVSRVPMEPGDKAAFVNLVGAARMFQRDYDGAEKYFLQIIEMLEAAGETKGLFRAYANMALISRERQDYEGFVAYSSKALAHARATGDPLAVLGVLLSRTDGLSFWLHRNLAVPDREARLSELKTLADEAESIAKKLNHLIFLQSIYCLRADLCAIEGNRHLRATHLKKAALVCEQAGAKHEASLALEQLCALAIEDGRYEQAAKLLGASIASRVDTSRPRREYEERSFHEVMKVLSDELGSDRLSEFLEFGASLAISDLCVLTEVPFSEDLK